MARTKKAVTPPTVKLAKGRCSVCPAGRPNEDADVVHVEHPKVNKNIMGKSLYFRFCLRCARLVGEAAGGQGAP